MHTLWCQSPRECTSRSSPACDERDPPAVTHQLVCWVTCGCRLVGAEALRAPQQRWTGPAGQGSGKTFRSFAVEIPRRKRESIPRLVRAPCGGRPGRSLGLPAPSSTASAAGRGGTSPVSRCRAPAWSRLQESRRARRPDKSLDPRKAPAGHTPIDRPYWDVRSGARPGGAS